MQVEKERPGYWAVLPSDVRYDPDLNPNAKLLYAEISALTNATGYCWATNEWFAELFHLSARTITRLVAQLEEKGYIRSEMASTEKGTERRIYAGIFSVQAQRGGLDENGNTPLPDQGGIDKNVDGGVDNFVEGGVDKNVERGVDKNVHQNNTSMNNTSMNNTPIAPKGAKRARLPKKQPDWKPERFAKLWAYYPRGEAKQKAIQAWDRLQPSDELIDAMARALERQMRSPEWQEGRYIPYLSTWLNQERWSDEERQPRPGAGGQAPPDHVLEEEGSYYL
jgi:hypothetical protein